MGEQPAVTMMRFEFATAARIMVGAGRVAELPGVLSGLGSRVLVCTGANPARHAGLLAGLGLPAAVFPVADRAHDRAGPRRRGRRARARR